MSKSVVAHPNTRNWKYHAEKIAAAWNKQIPSIIEAGQALIDAKKELEHGAYEAMVQSKLPFKPSTARTLKIIAEHSIISNRQHVDVLPASWGTLYELTRLPHDVLLAGLKDGSIHPKMERMDAKALHPAAKDKPKPASREELIAAIQKDPTANQRDAAAELGVSLGMYQRTRNELIGSGEIKGSVTVDDLISKLIEMLMPLSQEEKINKIDAVRVGLKLSTREWMTTVTIGTKGSK